MQENMVFHNRHEVLGRNVWVPLEFDSASGIDFDSALDVDLESGSIQI